MRKLLALLFSLLLIPTFASAQRAQNGALRAYGDSITFGIAASDIGVTDWVSLAGTYYGIPTVDHGVQGDTACDLAQHVFAGENPSAPVAGLYTVMVGTNDANNEGAGAYEAVYRNCHLAALSWLAIVRSSKVFAQDAGCVQSGTWTVDNTYQNGIGESSSTSGSALTCSITTQGNAVYIWYRLINTNTGTFTYSVDGGTAVAANAFTTPAMAENAGTTSVGVVRIPDVGAGVHSVKITVTSSNGSVPILGIGSAPPIGYVGQPVIYSAGVPYQQNDDMSATTAAYNADALADVNLIGGDGGEVYFVNVRAYWCTGCPTGSSADMANGLHPNDLGETEIANGFETEINIPLPLAQVKSSTNINGHFNARFN